MTNKQDTFIKQLKELNLNPELYLKIAKTIAKKRNYDESKLSFALNNNHKLKYDSPEGIKYFGKANYGDYIIWLFNEINGKVKNGYADMKRNVFHKSHSKISQIHNLNKFSSNELALNIIW